MIRKTWHNEYLNTIVEIVKHFYIWGVKTLNLMVFRLEVNIADELDKCTTLTCYSTSLFQQGYITVDFR